MLYLDHGSAPIPVSHTATEFHRLQELPVLQDDNIPQLHEGLPWTVKKRSFTMKNQSFSYGLYKI